MKDYHKIFSEKMRDFFGNPSQPAWAKEKTPFIKSENSQAIGPLLYSYMTPHPDNEWYKKPILLEAAEFILKDLAQSKDYYRFRRLLWVFADAYPLIEKCLPNLKSQVDVCLVHIANHFSKKLKERKHIRQLTSANIGYGTNHLAIELRGVVQYFKHCSSSLGNIEGIDEKFLKDYLKRFMDYMDPEGYWPETDGPALVYNRLTSSCLLGVAIELGEFNTYRKHFEKASEFHAYTTLPDGRANDIFDGRNSNVCVDHLAAVMLLTPGGKYWYDKMVPLHRNSVFTSYAFGQSLAFLMFDETVKEKYGAKEPASVWHPEKLEKKLGDFTIVKNQNWIAGVSNFKFRPRPEGHFTIDHQNLLSLYHTEFGEIFGGQNSKNDPEISFFSKFMKYFDGDLLTKPMPKYIPGKGKIEVKDNCVSVERDYRGFEGCFSVTFKDANHLELSLFARAREEEYPIQCNLILPCGVGRPIFSAVGEEINFDESPKIFTNKEVGSAVSFVEVKVPHLLEKGKNKKLKISVPSSATIKWPFKPWDTYNSVSDRELKAEKWYCVMHVDLTEKPVIIKIEIL